MSKPFVDFSASFNSKINNMCFGSSICKYLTSLPDAHSNFENTSLTTVLNTQNSGYVPSSKLFNLYSSMQICNLVWSLTMKHLTGFKWHVWQTAVRRAAWSLKLIKPMNWSKTGNRNRKYSPPAPSHMWQSSRDWSSLDLTCPNPWLGHSKPKAWSKKSKDNFS